MVNKPERIGLFGGTFDPVHQGHYAIVASAIEQLELDEVWLLIDGRPRRKAACTSFHHRVEMAKIAFSDHTAVKIDEYPFQQDGRTHGLASMKEIHQFVPAARLFILAGIDALEHFPEWEKPEIFCRLVTFCCYAKARQRQKSIGGN